MGLYVDRESPYWQVRGKATMTKTKLLSGLKHGDFFTYEGKTYVLVPTFVSPRGHRVNAVSSGEFGFPALIYIRPNTEVEG